MIKKILAIHEIKKGICNNLLNEISIYDSNDFMENTLKNSNNLQNVKLTVNNEDYLLVNNMYFNPTRDKLLLESRLINTRTGGDVGAYLPIINVGDMQIDNEFIDDVWSYTEWTMITD